MLQSDHSDGAQCAGSNRGSVVDRLLALVDREELLNVAVLVGGGEAADLVRRWDRQFGLSDSVAHTLAIESMSLNAKLLASLHDRLVLVNSLAEWRSTHDSSPDTVAILHPTNIVAELELIHAALPQSWDVTSDSLAAWIAVCCRVPQLLLLKSTDIDVSAVEHARVALATVLADSGVVDSQFPQIACDVEHFAWCNFRAPACRTLALW
ncbi:hypothetical protein Fuma_01645 [Fuerstiella marisgermanici]|uniref:Uncharacterized protein n=1 Tax=Fuerstiella marisgermanici TaxID=1891926 RepID=A0A1P8WDC9_9PLAN|nr:hypothetical protein Fuma_01645 [Fuerstiella marisgermanici]